MLQEGQVLSCNRLLERYESHRRHIVGVVVALGRVALLSHQFLEVAWHQVPNLVVVLPWHQVPPIVVLLLVVGVVGGIGVGLIVVVGVAERSVSKTVNLKRSRSCVVLKLG